MGDKEHAFVLNEVQPGGDPRIPSSVYVFFTQSDAVAYIEPWYVEETYILIRDDGRRFRFERSDPAVRLVPYEGDDANYKELAAEFLRHHLTSILKLSEQARQNPSMSLEEMITCLKTLEDKKTGPRHFDWLRNTWRRIIRN